MLMVLLAALAWEKSDRISVKVPRLGRVECRIRESEPARAECRDSSGHRLVDVSMAPAERAYFAEGMSTRGLIWLWGKKPADSDREKTSELGTTKPATYFTMLIGYSGGTMRPLFESAIQTKAPGALCLAGILSRSFSLLAVQDSRPTGTPNVAVDIWRWTGAALVGPERREVSASVADWREAAASVGYDECKPVFIGPDAVGAGVP